MVHAGVQRWCVWSGLAALALYLVGYLLLADFVPPPAPNRSAVEIASLYADHTNAIRAGVLVAMWGSALLAPFLAVISVQLKRIEGPSSPLAYTQLLLGVCLVLEFLVPQMLFETAAFRAERSAESIQALNDLGWLLFMGINMTAILELVVIGIAVLNDRRAAPIFPRWVGFLNFAEAFLLFPGCLCVFFKGGPLAWVGLFCWWIPVSSFLVWLVVMTVMLLRAVAAQAAEARADVAAVAGEPFAPMRRVELLEAELAAVRAELDQVKLSAVGPAPETVHPAH